MVKFKYIKNYGKLIGISEKKECTICKKIDFCFSEKCKKCYNKQESLKRCPEEFRHIYTVARPEEIRKQLKESNPDWSEEKIAQIAKTRDNEIEHGTPSLNGYQWFKWPCLEGDYCEFIAYGCKPFYNNWSASKTGKEVFGESIHEESRGYLYENFWEERVPDEKINTSEDTNYATLFFVFKSLYSEKIITYIDSM